MIKKLSNVWNSWSLNGVKLPFAYDAITKSPSITLLFAYITFITMIGSLILLHLYKQLLEATIVSVIVWVLAVIFYRFKELDKVNLNLKTGSIDIEDTPNEKDK